MRCLSYPWGSLCKSLCLSLLLASVLGVGGSVSLAQEDEVAGAGKGYYQTYCASCHGIQGKGDGPMADILTVKPADLTQLSTGNEGRFPFWRVYRIIDGREEVKAHGPRAMPIWGNWFQQTEGSEPRAVGRILELAHYLKSIQEPTAAAEDRQQ